MEASLTFIPLIFAFPIAGLLVNAFFGKYLGEKGPGVLASLMAGLSFVTAVVAWATLGARGYEGEEVRLWQWIATGPLFPGGPEFNVDLGFLVDTLAVTMCLVVTGVGTLIHVYAIGYMAGDPRVPRFFVYMNLFLASMLVLVLGNSYLVMFVGWELVGLCSYLLIGFWFDKGENGIGNAIAAKKAFVVNRVGDFGFILGIFLIWSVFGTLNYHAVFAQLGGEGGGEHLARALAQAAPVAPGLLTAIGLLLLVGATGKSAQIPLFVWLPDAMAGPTPVSALIHAATMVTAGIYMITRSQPIYDLAPEAQAAVALIGAATAFAAGTMAVAQFDIKRVLAFSTISQLGFMIAAVGMGAYVAGMFHLITHAFFKALLFLGSGSVIHGVEHGEHHAHALHAARAQDVPHRGKKPHEPEDEADASGHKPAHGAAPFDPQDMRNMGGLLRRMPVTGWTFIIGALALAGIVPLAGFWSKDEILAEAFEFGFGHPEAPPAVAQAYPWVPQIVFVTLLIAAGFTAFYMTRQVWMVFFGKPRSAAAQHAPESVASMTVPLVILAVLSVLGGAINAPVFSEAAREAAQENPGLAGALALWLHHSSETLHTAVGVLDFAIAGGALTLAVLAGLLGYALYRNRPARAEDPDPLQKPWFPFEFLRRRWYWDDVYEAVIIGPYKAFARFLAMVVDGRFWKDFVHDTVIAGGFRAFAYFMSRPVDLGIVDGAVNGIARLIGVSADRGRRVETGYVRNYALSVLLGVVLLVAYFVFVATR